jgi:hypothetical protein
MLAVNLLTRSLRTDVSALYVDPRGPYPNLVADWWDEKRDARTYEGPWPVVAHPPCGPWGSLYRRSLETTRDLAVVAVSQVRAYGGVLEHPRGSKLFRHLLMPFPGELPDAWGGRTYDLEQVSWGHPCRKPTWIYVVGVAPVRVRPLRGGEPTHQIWGSSHALGHRHRTDLRAAHEGMRRRTPPAFARWLVEIASQARR